MSSNALPQPLADRGPWDEPEVEVIRGIELPKVSPRRTHGILQGAFFELLNAWASKRGDVATEWRFHIHQPSGETDTLVPDVAFLAADVLDALTDEEAEEPHVAPTIVVEIRSPYDRARNVAAKVNAYLSAGTRLVVDVDPATRVILAYDDSASTALVDGTTFEHRAAPGWRFDVTSVFDRTRITRTPGNR